MGIVKEAEEGATVAELCRRRSISESMRSSDVTALVGSQEVLLEGELGPVGFGAGDQPGVLAGLEEVIAGHDDAGVAGVEDALGVDAPGR